MPTCFIQLFQLLDCTRSGDSLEAAMDVVRTGFRPVGVAITPRRCTVFGLHYRQTCPKLPLVSGPCLWPGCSDHPPFVNLR